MSEFFLNEIEILKSFENYFKSIVDLLRNPPFLNENKSLIKNLFIEPVLEAEMGETLSSTTELIAYKKTIIIGPPGCGKTTLLKHLTDKVWNFYIENPEKNAIPFFIPFRKFASDTILSAILKIIFNYLDDFTSKTGFKQGLQQFDNVIDSLFERGKIFFLIDGLDDLETSERVLVFGRIDEFSKHYPNLHLIMTTRPTATRDYFLDFKKVFIKPFNGTQISSFINNYGNNKKLNKDLITLIKNNNFLMQIAGSPLLLAILTSVYSVSGILPNSELSIFQDLTEYTLSTWDSQKRRYPSILTFGEKNDLIERLAYYMVTQNKINVTNSEFITLIQILFGKYKFSYNVAQSILEEFLTTGLLYEREPKDYEFIHSLFQEYYFAKYLSRNPRNIVPILSNPKLIAIGKILTLMVEDINQYIEIAIEQKQTYLAAIFASFGSGSRESLIQQVVSDLLNELGPRFSFYLLQSLSHKQYDTNPLEYGNGKNLSDLRDLWRDCQINEKDPNLKGKKLEIFCSRFFQFPFKVVKSNLHTDNGEIDLLLEILNNEPFWIEFGGDALVECKNWDNKLPIKELEAFCYKVSQSRLKLGFIIAINGLTKDAEESLKQYTSDSKNPIIVSLKRTDIDEMLNNNHSIHDNIKEMIRNVKYKRKY